MKINKIEFDSSKLLSKQEVIDYLTRNGENDRELGDLLIRHEAEFGNTLLWRYPISDSKHAGGAILVVKEGFLWLPYDCVEEHDYEIYKLDEAKMFDSESLEFFIDDWKSFSDDLLGAMNDMLSIIRKETGGQK